MEDSDREKPWRNRKVLYYLWDIMRYFAFPISVNPYYNKLVVHVVNVGIDSIDSVTVSGTATDYGTLSSKTSWISGKVKKGC